MLHGSVGVAPSTMTIALPPYRRWNPYSDISSLKSGLNGLGVIDPKDWWMTGQSYGLPGTASVYLPQGRMHPPAKRQSAGGRLNGLGIIPGEITRSINGLGNLGAIPTDFELATYREYLPVQSGWTTAQQGLGESSELAAEPNLDCEHPRDSIRVKMMKRSVKNQRTALRLQIITTSALAILAAFKIGEFFVGKKG